MSSKRAVHDGLVYALAGVFLALFFYLYPRLYPDSALRLRVSKTEMLEKGNKFLQKIEYDTAELPNSIQLEYNANQLRYLNKEYGSAETNRYIANVIPVYYWTIRWFQSSDTTSGVMIRMGSDESKDEATEHLNRILGDIQLSMDLQGRPVGFEYTLDEDSENVPESIQVALSSEEERYALADMIAQKLISLYGGEWTYVGNPDRSNLDGRSSQYQWVREGRVAGGRVSLKVGVTGNRIRSFRKEFSIPKPYSEERERGNYLEGTIVLVILVVFILGVIQFVRRLRADLIDLKTGVIPGILALLGWIVVYWTQTSIMSDENFIPLLIGFGITAPFIFGGIWALFSVGESLTREVWSEKLTVLDMMRRRFFFPGFGLSLTRGLALAFIGVGLLTAMQYIGIQFFGGYFNLGDSTQYEWTSGVPALFVMGDTIMNTPYIITTLCLFIMALIRRKTQKLGWLIPILFVCWSLFHFPVPMIQPFILKMLISGIVGLLFVFFFFQYEFVSVFTGALSMPILYYTSAFFWKGLGLFTWNGLILLAFFILLFILIILARKGEDPSGEVAPYVPDYLQRIYERERFQKELEIARNVQLQFLPRETPKISDLEIASLCVPAREVGGDYYDFIEMDAEKLGVVIGDVSGKGVSAAFYMTMTKGFLKSQAREMISPRDVLINMNALFYENVERGVFISMIYGVFDLKSRTLTFARAGHNPMIFRRSGKGQAEELSPPGIALGLEAGDVFAKTIEERTIGISGKDVFLFYTDGLNESMNLFQEEYGEERLRTLVEGYNQYSAENILNKIQEDIQNFTADAPQHDDMTAVVVKVLR